MSEVSKNAGVSHAPSERAAYPMVRGGGLFLMCIGIGLISAILSSGDALVNYPVFYVSVAVATISLFAARRLSYGSPTRLHLVALMSAIALEVFLLTMMGRTLPPGTEEHVRWLWVSIIVGVHFLPMAICFGPRMLLLGGACVAIAIAGLLLVSLPYEIFGLTDGGLKFGFGIWLLSTKPLTPLADSASESKRRIALR